MTVAEMLELIPEDKRGEAKELVEQQNPLESVRDADSAVEFIKSHDVLKRAYDKIAQSAVESHKKRFEEEKLPEIRKQLRDEVRKELNPEETLEQKRLRELEEQLRERDKKEQLYQTREKLRGKAKELGFDEDLAERFAYMQTEDPESELATFAERMQQAVQSAAEKEVNNRWPSKAPKTSAGTGGKIESADQVPSEWTPADYARAKEAGQIAYKE